MPFYKGHKINIGRKMSDLTKQKISKKNKNRVFSKEIKEKHRQNILKRYMRGEIIGFQKGHSIVKGMHWKIKDTSKMGQGQRGKISHRKGVTLTDETKQKIREWNINHPNRKYKDTKIELLIEEELKIRNIKYNKQVPLCKVAVVDFYLPDYRIIIQCDGDYWHSFKKQKEKDNNQDKTLIENGYKVYRFWEREINKSAEECINRCIFYN